MGGPRIAVVTDSTASLPVGVAERWGIDVVPLEVALGDARYREGVDLTTADLLGALVAGSRVTTSQPPPAAFAAAYARAAERGADAVVSVHLSGELSGTVRAAELAAADAPLPVHVVDSRTVAMGLGFAALAAAELVAGGSGANGLASTGSAAAERAAGGDPVNAGRVAERARSVAATTSVLVVVDSLDHLRRGGRVGATTAAVGGLLGTRPLLAVRDGRVEVAGTVRSRRAARERLVAAAVTAVTDRPGTRVAVHHLGRPDLGEELAAEVRGRLAAVVRGPGEAGDGPGRGAAGSPASDDVVVADVSAVLGAHVGPGLLGVVIAGA